MHVDIVGHLCDLPHHVTRDDTIGEGDLEDPHAPVDKPANPLAELPQLPPDMRAALAQPLKPLGDSDSRMYDICDFIWACSIGTALK